MKQTLAILGYHKIGEPAPGGWETWLLISDAVFVRQLNYLRNNGWKVIDLATAMAGLETPERLPPRTALLTFDDAYHSITGCAATRLAEFGYPAVLFVPTNFIGGHNQFDANTHQPKEAICTWDDLRELSRRDFSIQSHSVSHRTFSELDPESQEQELAESKAQLEEGIGKPVEAFAYPYGDGGSNPGATTALLQKLGYKAAYLFGGAPNQIPISNRFRLTRVAMGAETDLQLEFGGVP
jgi:peptidoglycan/xylan/chitin deacetylase (PgdA/CDA1 family)